MICFCVVVIYMFVNWCNFVLLFWYCLFGFDYVVCVLFVILVVCLYLHLFLCVCCLLFGLVLGGVVLLVCSLVMFVSLCLVILVVVLVWLLVVDLLHIILLLVLIVFVCCLLCLRCEVASLVCVLLFGEFFGFGLLSLWFDCWLTVCGACWCLVLLIFNCYYTCC